MRTHRGLVIAAHDSPRLGALTADRPAALLEVSGRSLIDHQLGTLGRCGVDSVCVVTGHVGLALRDHLGSRAAVVTNMQHETTGSLYSLWLAREHLLGGAVVLQGETLFPPRLLERLLVDEAPDALVVDRAPTARPRGRAVVLAGAFVADVTRTEPPDPSSATVVGLLKLGPEGARRLLDVLEGCVRHGAARATVVDAVAELAHSWPVVAVDVDGLPWAHVDSVEGLGLASRVVAMPRGSHGRDPRAGARR